MICMTTTSASKTVEVLRDLFSRYGLPQVVVSDNGPQFVSKEFSEFMQNNSISHRRGPATNGEAERFVRTFKSALHKGKRDEGTLVQKLAQFLFVFRTTPHATTGIAPVVYEATVTNTFRFAATISKGLCEG